LIAIVYPQFYGVGGIARYIDSFLANLPPLDRPIILITSDQLRSPPVYPGVEIIHLPFSTSRANSFLWGLRVRKLLRELHRAGRIRWVNLHWPPLIPGLFLPPEIPLLVTAHTTYLGMSGRFYATRHYESQWSPASVRVKMWMERRILAKASRVITLTEQGSQEVRRYGFKGPIGIIPNGADIQKFGSTGSAARDIDVLFSGRIELRKGSRPMVRICKELVAARPDIRICIVGYGDDDAWVNSELAPLQANVTLAGKVPFDAMVRYYERSRVYVSTSYYEGLPGTCLEAMGMSLPAVVWDFLFYRGLVVEGQTGMLAPPNDFASMATKIGYLLDHPAVATQLGKAAHDLIVERYDWSRLAPEVLAQFE